MTLRLFALCGIVAAFLATVYVVLWGQARGWAPPIDNGWRELERVDAV
jgi:hypothetical protein